MAQTAEAPAETKNVRLNMNPTIWERIQKYRGTILAQGEPINFSEAVHELLDKALTKEKI
jgi:hypothetical protein